MNILSLAAALACACLLAGGQALASTTWGSPTPVTLAEWEVARTPEGRLISWRGIGEHLTRGYQIQIRERREMREESGEQAEEAWKNISSEIPAAGAGAEGQFYAWHHRTRKRDLEYRLMEIYRGAWVLRIDETDPDVRKLRDGNKTGNKTNQAP